MGSKPRGHGIVCLLLERMGQQASRSGSRRASSRQSKGWKEGYLNHSTIKLEICVNKFLERLVEQSLPLIPSFYVRSQDTPKHSMAPKRNQVALTEKNINSTAVGQSSTTPSDGSNSASPIKINSKSTPFATLPAMVTEATMMEEQVAQMAQALADLQKIVEDKDLQISQLMNKLEPTNAGESSHKHSSASKHEMIANTIKAQYGRSAQNSPAYSKPYSKWIDALRMPIGYQPPKLQQFDGKGNPKQHIAHFIETCNNVDTDDVLLVK
ncbi:UNVERIFIED_CONTAM: hypothetical protein Slati_2685900 [Sesamum latifolium]|uniref:Ty3-gypsy retrotransposon protein n=1 Tax=Sesamum latifolium TaxID=2727402 RepID=A0AAW2VYM9_9LAMI